MSIESRNARLWVGTAFAAGQLASVASGLFPWAAAIATLAVTLVVARHASTAGARYVRAAQVVALCLVLGVGLDVVLVTHSSLSAGVLDPLSTLRSLTWLLVVLTLVMAPTWHTVRDYRAWIGVTAGLLIAGAAPTSSGGRAVSTSITLILSWGVLLVATMMLQRAALVARAAVVAVPAGEPRRSPPALTEGARLIAPIAASVVAGSLVFLVFPSTAGGAGVPFRLAHDLLHSGSRVTSTRATAGVDTRGSGDLDLRVRGALAATPLLRVPVRSPALWRGTIYASYSGQSWQSENYPAFPFVATRGTDVAVPSEPDDPPAPGAVSHRYLVSPQQSHAFSLIWAPGVLLRVASSGLEQVARSAAFSRIVADPAGSPYTVTAAVPTRSASVLGVTPATATPDGVWTALPAELPSRISTLARAATTGATTRYAQVTDLERYLRGHETYSLASPVPAVNSDAVDDFLFRDHVGFCEQFASAEAVMLRTLGVPARVVSGLAYGVRDGQTRLLRASDAHAWVEVYYPNAGWVPTDPTAGVALADAASSGNWLTRAVGHVTAVVPGGGLGILVILIGLALAAAAGQRLAERRPALLRRSRSAADPETGAPVLAAFHRFAARRRRAQARIPSETAREYVGRSAVGQRVHAAVGTLERESYGAAPPDEPEVSAAVAAFDETIACVKPRVTRYDA
jgi:protein-glutamine gamma-glutamyltransferase